MGDGEAPARTEPTKPLAGSNVLSFKDWVTLTLSILAFVISAGTAYFNIVLQEDDVSVVFHSAPLAFGDGGENLSVTAKDSDVVFINSGNRAAVIISVNILFAQYDEMDRPNNKCSDLEMGTMTSFQTNFEPLVVKAKEVIAKKIKIVASPYYEKIKITGTDGYAFPISEKNKGKESFSMEVCLEIHVATPSTSYHRAIVSAFKYDVGNSGIYVGGYGLPDAKEAANTAWRTPQVIIKESGTIFRH